MALNNPFLSYIDRSYDQIKQTALNYLTTLTPEITDHNESNILVRMLSVWASIAEMLGYYIDNMARETFLTRCRLYWTGVKIANQYDYRIASQQPATVDLVFSVTHPTGAPFAGLTIPIGTEIVTADGISFFTTAAASIPAYVSNEFLLSVTVPATNARPVTGLSLGTSDGTANQVFEIPNQVAGFSTVAFVSFVAWSNVETFAYSAPATQAFVQTVNEQRKVIIKFGDGVNGAIPPLGAAITLNYDQCDGVTGNVAANSLTNIVSPPVVPAGWTLSVTNPNRAAGGTDVESLDSLKKHIPLLIRTHNTAVTYQNYIDIGNLHPDVEQTSIFFNCGKTVNVYIVPNGGGIASGVLIADVQNWYESRRMVTTRVRVQAAGEIRIQLAFTLRIAPNYIRSQVETAVINNLLAYFSTANQQIGGTVHISDIYQTIDNTTGVLSSTISAIVPVPYARPSVTNINQVLTWTPSITTASTTTNRWTIQFLSATNFNLFKDNNFVGNFSTGALVSQTEVQFTITGTYAINDTFEFYTYPYTTNDLQLQEQSIPTALASDFAITSVGGI